MTHDDPVPDEQSELQPPSRPPRTAVGAQFSRRPEPVGFRSNDGAAGKPRFPWRWLRIVLQPIAAFIVIGCLLRFLADAPEMRALGGIMAVAGGIMAVVAGVAVLAAWRYFDLR